MAESIRAHEAAAEFVYNQTAFHLGDLTTEQSHPITRELSSVIQSNTAQGLKDLLTVDRDIIQIAKRTIHQQEFDVFIQSIVDTIRAGGKIIFSSCGASGRLAIILEAMWREFWGNNPASEQVLSIMTGGERALIRSVENFEDYQVFGRKQVEEANVNSNDYLIALTEGGEISSVIGTMKEALERGAKVAMLYNNPRELLIDKFQRSREVLTDERILGIELTTGPMALSGSTRMQATTIGLLVAGIAIEESFCLLKGQKPPNRDKCVMGFSNMLDQLSGGQALLGLQHLLNLETQTYSEEGRITYLADRYLLDIFSDTTERTPTFMIPPFKSEKDMNAPEPWAFAQDPIRPSNDAWLNMLRREPRGLDWDTEDYVSMEAQDSIAQSPPKLSQMDILSYNIGNTRNPDRSRPQDWYLSFYLDELVRNPDNPVLKNLLGGAKHKTVIIGNAVEADPIKDQISIPIDIPKSQINLYHHLAIKLILNTISTGTMACLGRIKGNWMIQVDATNKKLIDRATRIIQHFSGESYRESCLQLHITMFQPEVDRKNFKVSYVVQTLERMGIQL